MRAEYILQTLRKRSLQNQVDTLLDALELMKQDNTKSTSLCIGLAMGLPEDPQILHIDDINGHEITVTFNNGEKRLIHFDKIFDGTKKFHTVLLNDQEKFKKIEVVEGTLAWKSLGNWTKDLEGNDVFHYFDIDPGVLYECSSPLTIEVNSTLNLPAHKIDSRYSSLFL